MANEKRLIYAEDALAAEFSIEEDGAIGYVVDSEVIRRLPTVDAVEVVRCRDCIHRRNGKDCTNPLLLSYSWGAIRNVKDDDFCPYGERRTEDE